MTAQVGLDPAFLRSYDEYYAAKNVYMIEGRNHLWPGNVCHDQMLCPEEKLVRCEFYHDWMVPQRLGHAISATVLKTRSLTGLFGVIQPL